MAKDPNAQIEKLQKQLDELKDQKKRATALDKELAKLKKSSSADEKKLKKKSSELESQLKEANKENKALKSQVNHLESKLETAEQYGEAAGDETTGLKNEVKSLRKEVADAEKKLSAQQSEEARLTARLQSEMKRMQNEILNARKRTEDQKSILAGKSGEFAALEKQLKDAERKARSYKERATIAEQAEREARRQIDGATESAEQVGTDLEAAQKELADLKESTRAAAQDLRSELDESAKTEGRLRLELEEIKDKLRDAEKVAEEKNRVIDENTRELQRLKSLETDLEYTRRRIVQLEDDVKKASNIDAAMRESLLKAAKGAGNVEKNLEGLSDSLSALRMRITRIMSPIDGLIEQTKKKKALQDGLLMAKALTADLDRNIDSLATTMAMLRERARRIGPQIEAAIKGDEAPKAEAAAEEGDDFFSDLRDSIENVVRSKEQGEEPAGE